MTTKKIYRYLGRNGILTSYILIEDAKHIPLIELIADEGKILTNGKKTVRTVIIEESDIDTWSEIADKSY